VRVYAINCFYGGQEWDYWSVWSTREAAEEEIQRIKDDPKSGPAIYGYDLDVDEWQIDPPPYGSEEDRG
jgi:hypothetical protein